MKTLSPEYQRNLTLLCVIAALACVVFAGIVGTSSLGQGQEIDRNSEQAQTAKEQVKVARDKVVGSDSTLAKTVRRLGRTQRKQDRFIRQLRSVNRTQNRLIRDLIAGGARLPSVIKNSPGPPGATGARGRTGASATPMQIQAAVARYCEANRCSAPPTQEQVNAAIRACSAAGGCRGARGDDGKDGRDGKDGVSPPPPPTLPCPQVDSALKYQCVPEADTPPPPPPAPLLP